MFSKNEIMAELPEVVEGSVGDSNPILNTVKCTGIGNHGCCGVELEIRKSNLFKKISFIGAWITDWDPAFKCPRCGSITFFKSYKGPMNALPDGNHYKYGN